MLLAFVGVGAVLWLAVFTFLPAALAIALVFIPQVSRQSSTVKTSFKADFNEGMTFIKKSGLMPLLILFAVGNFLVNPLFSLIPLFLQQVHSAGPNEFALIEVIVQVGIFAGSLLIVVWKFQPKMKSILITDILLLESVIALAFVPAGNYWLLGLIVLFAGFSIALIDVQFISLLQVTIPAELQGRVFSSVFLMIKCILPVAMILMGLIAEVIPLTVLFIVCPAIAMVLVLYALIGSKKWQVIDQLAEEIIETSKLTAIPALEFR